MSTVRRRPSRCERLLGEELQQAEVLHDLVAARRALNLDDHPLTRLQGGEVNLADRPGGERLRVDARRRRPPTARELFLHHRDDLRLGERRDGSCSFASSSANSAKGDPAASKGSGRALRTSGRASRALRAAASRVPAARPRPGASRANRAIGARSRRPGRGAGPRLRRLGRRLGRHGAVGRVDDHDRATGAVRDAVRDVPEQELLAAAHAGVADDEHVRRLFLGGTDDRRGDVRVDPEEVPGLPGIAAASERSASSAPSRGLGGAPGAARARRRSGPRAPAAQATAWRGGLGAVGGDDHLHGDALFQHETASGGNAHRRRAVQAARRQAR